MLLKNKTALITGATRGIGKAIALAFAKEGASLIINGRKESLLKKLKVGIEAEGVKCVVVQGDITTESTINNLLETSLKDFGNLDILVNNAGIISRKQLSDMHDDDWYKVLDVNLNSNFNLSKQILLYFKKQKSGKIINISSSAAKKPHPNAAPSYGASKAAIVSLTQHFALKMGQYGVCVNAICPGPIETDMSKDWDAEYRSRVIKKIPLGRIGKPEEVAELAVFLASNKADFITGEAININGGSFMD